MNREFRKLSIENRELLRNFIKQNYDYIKILIDCIYIEGSGLKDIKKVNFNNDDVIEELIKYLPTVDEYKDRFNAKVNDFISAFRILYVVLDLFFISGSTTVDSSYLKWMEDRIFLSMYDNSWERDE